MKKNGMEFFIKTILKSSLNSGGPSYSLSNAKDAEQEVNAEFSKAFGDDWQILPFTSIRGMAALFILDKILTPFGVTPRSIVEITRMQLEEFEVDAAFSSFLETISKTGEITKDTVNSGASLLGNTAKEASLLIEAGFLVGTNYASKILKRKSLLFKNKKDGSQR